MARFLYRMLRLINFFGTVEESQLRLAMRNSSMLEQLQRLFAAEFSKPLSYAARLTGHAMSPLLNQGVSSMNETRDKVCPCKLPLFPVLVNESDKL